MAVSDMIVVCMVCMLWFGRIKFLAASSIIGSEANSRPLGTFGAPYCSGNTYKRISLYCRSRSHDQYFRTSVRGSSSNSGELNPYRLPANLTLYTSLRHCMCVMDSPALRTQCAMYCEICKVTRYVAAPVLRWFEFSVVSCSLVCGTISSKI